MVSSMHGPTHHLSLSATGIVLISIGSALALALLVWLILSCRRLRRLEASVPEKQRTAGESTLRSLWILLRPRPTHGVVQEVKLQKMAEEGEYAVDLEAEDIAVGRRRSSASSRSSFCPEVKGTDAKGAIHIPACSQTCDFDGKDLDYAEETREHTLSIDLGSIQLSTRDSISVDQPKTPSSPTSPRSNLFERRKVPEMHIPLPAPPPMSSFLRSAFSPFSASPKSSSSPSMFSRSFLGNKKQSPSSSNEDAMSLPRSVTPASCIVEVNPYEQPTSSNAFRTPPERKQQFLRPPLVSRFSSFATTRDESTPDEEEEELELDVDSAAGSVEDLASRTSSPGI